MTPYNSNNLYPVACPILPERKHRRCFEGSQKKNNGSEIRGDQHHARRYIRFSWWNIRPQALINRMYGVLKQYVVAPDLSARENRCKSKMTVFYPKMTVNVNYVSEHTLKSLKIAVKRICTGVIDPQKPVFRTKTPGKRIITRFLERKIHIGGYASIIF